MLSKNEFQRLTQARGPGCISIYLPTHRRGRETRQDPIRFGNLLREAERRARGSRAGDDAIDAALAPMRALLDDEEFWRHQADGLALFARDGEFACHRLQHAVDELTFVGDRYCVRPLLPSRDVGQRFFVLAFSQRRVRLLECTRENARELDLHDVPESLAEAVGYDFEQKSLQFHTGAPRRGGGRADAVFHGHGSGDDDDSKVEIEKFARDVDDGVCRLLQQRAPKAPLVLAAVGFVADIYRSVSRNPQIVDAGLEGNPDEIDAMELQRAALPLAEPALTRGREQQLERLAAARHADHAVSGVEDVLEAAREARIDTMFVATDTAQWGSYGPETAGVEVHAHRCEGDDELLDLAVAMGMEAGAEVFGLKRAS